MPNPKCPKSWTINAKRVMYALRDAVKHTPGGSRFSTKGQEIQPMGIEYAAEVTGRTRTYMDTAINPEDDGHRLQLEDFLLLLQSGQLDLSVLDEMERLVNRVAFPLPDSHTHQDLAAELMGLGKEFGDVFNSLSEAMKRDSDRGEEISMREFTTFSREVDELIAKACELREEVRARVKS